MPSVKQNHPTWSMTYQDRALLPETSPLTAYLLRLISIKRSNLCLSADVTSTAELLELAEDVGDSICLLKTHADIISDFSDRTVRGLREIARRKRFLVFEDRKFGDIGSTVQKQYTAGPLSIAKWAEIVNCHIFPGPAIISSLKSAAQDAISAYNSGVETSITVGSPNVSRDSSSSPTRPDHEASNETGLDGNSLSAWEQNRQNRKQSIVSISTTISMQTESISPQPTPFFDSFDNAQQPESLPYLRSLLLIAEMSSEGNLCSGSYTDTCVSLARQHRDFVMGFIAQRSLNTEEGDNFITMTPGCSLPPPGQEGKPTGDGQGQQYDTPRNIVAGRGSDIVIVGRGILSANDRRAEAARYRKESWEAYEERIGQ
ncbi:orotidine-5'-phosphate decarboxylase [Aulographum hederae CBS 113979]|uniref:Orotidine 5'-phosphate decarboxylase n=1 Tax=Aulographum hederae CBS 113979 TaxID=1176131 RepID=A0A6G1H186_9PEZI|nr:orotidine-5'-phosphate decarboxylase [Aulographum hederae CBS 113979]